MAKGRDKGTRLESALVKAMRLAFPKIARTGSAAFGDGDFFGVEPFFIDAKNRVRMELASWVDGTIAGAARVEKRTGKIRIPLVIHKRSQTNESGAYVTTTVEHFVRMMVYFRTGETVPLSEIRKFRLEDDGVWIDPSDPFSHPLIHQVYSDTRTWHEDAALYPGADSFERST